MGRKGGMGTRADEQIRADVTAQSQDSVSLTQFTEAAQG